MPSKREIALAQMRVAGYHEDRKSFLRLYVESRVSMCVANQAFANGQRLRAQGVPCSCPDCAKGGAK
jgi:hypothetical protein